VEVENWIENRAEETLSEIAREHWDWGSEVDQKTIFRRTSSVILLNVSRKIYRKIHENYSSPFANLHIKTTTWKRKKLKTADSRLIDWNVFKAEVRGLDLNLGMTLGQSSLELRTNKKIKNFGFVGGKRSLDKSKDIWKTIRSDSIAISQSSDYITPCRLNEIKSSWFFSFLEFLCSQQ
jgi:hypothetical protein